MLRLISLIAIVLLHDKTLSSDELPLRRNTGDDQALLVLNSGRVVSGQLTPRTGGYDVQLPAGRMFIGSEQVRFQAQSMDDAYRRMRNSLNEHTPNTHMQLAKWCLANAMPAKARKEVLDALHLDPNRNDAKRMLEALVREQRTSITTAGGQQVSPGGASRYDTVTLNHPSMMPERRSLGGLPKSLARMFTQTVQPIVVNRCGNARCHGARQNSFSVVSIRGGSTSRIAEQNLAAILNHIDTTNPSQSPILTATKGLHGNSRQLLFPGQSGGRQAAALRKWVITVAQEIAPSQPSPHTGQPATTKHKGAVSRGVPHGEETIDSPKDHRTAQDTRFVQDAVVATRHDAFDPDIFNRRYHQAAVLESRDSGND
ncbi:MAG: hypothetical protein P8K08_24885 [Fuerstiella sp.]|jgi:hypothetical protein|nr:hypothetical protein [Fuerstiella sp.]